MTTAKAPEMAMACPACPSVRCKSLAIGVSKLTGMNSDATRVEAQSVSARTAPHEAARGPAPSADNAVWTVMRCVCLGSLMSPDLALACSYD